MVFIPSVMSHSIMIITDNSKHYKVVPTSVTFHVTNKKKEYFYKLFLNFTQY